MSPRNPPPTKRSAKAPKLVRDMQQRGLQLFQAGKYDDAIAIWSRILPPQASLTAALAEAYFRRSLTRALNAERILDLRQALKLRPHEQRYHYHLGLALHRDGHLDAAIEQYEAILRQAPGWRGANLVLALARLEQEPSTDLATLPGYNAQVRTILAPAQSLLRGVAPAIEGEKEKSIERLWRGLGGILQGDGSAQEALSDTRTLPAAGAAMVRRYYLGVAAAQAGDFDAALAAWQLIHGQQFETPWLRDNLTAVILQRVSEQDSADIARIAQIAHESVKLAAGNTALADPVIQALDRGAQAAAAGGDWTQATMFWLDAREVVSTNAGIGSPRPILHNLALAYEAQEQWMQAAEMWRAMLRTRARKGGDGGQPDDAQWAWVRKRVIECYKSAGAPGEAVTIFRQAIKATPDDLDVRLQLVDALIANEQAQAAVNEIERILAIDPAHIDARLRGAALLGIREEFEAGRAMLRPVLEQQPEHQDARQGMVALLLAEGQRNLRWYNLPAAERLFEQAQHMAPNDWRPPINRARIAIDQKKLDLAGKLLARVLDLAGDQPEAYLQVIDAWAVADQMDQVRAAVARAESALPLTADFFIEVGLMLLQRDHPPAPGFLGGLLSRPPKRGGKETPRSRLASELLDRGLAGQPEQGEVRIALAIKLLRIDPVLGLRYAEEAARMLPDDPDAYMTLATLQVMNERRREAKDTLRRGARLARKQGKADLAEHMDDLRASADDPMIPLMLQMGPLFDEDDDEDEDDAFW